MHRSFRIAAVLVVSTLAYPALAQTVKVTPLGTVDGKVRPGSKTEAFVRAVKVPVHVPL